MDQQPQVLGLAMKWDETCFANFSPIPYMQALSLYLFWDKNFSLSRFVKYHIQSHYPEQSQM